MNHLHEAQTVQRGQHGFDVRAIFHDGASLQAVDPCAGLHGRQLTQVHLEAGGEGVHAHGPEPGQKRGVDREKSFATYFQMGDPRLVARHLMAVRRHDEAPPFGVGCDQRAGEIGVQGASRNVQRIAGACDDGTQGLFDIFISIVFELDILKNEGLGRHAAQWL